MKQSVLPRRQHSFTFMALTSTPSLPSSLSSPWGCLLCSLLRHAVDRWGPKKESWECKRHSRQASLNQTISRSGEPLTPILIKHNCCIMGCNVSSHVQLHHTHTHTRQCCLATSDRAPLQAIEAGGGWVGARWVGGGGGGGGSVCFNTYCIFFIFNIS